MQEESSKVPSRTMTGLHARYFDRRGKLLSYLCQNPHPDVIEWIEANIGLLTHKCWAALSANPGAVRLLEANMDKVSLGDLMTNPSAIHLIEQVLLDRDNGNFHMWIRMLSQNCNAMHLIDAHSKHVSPWHMCKNTNPRAMEWVEAFLLRQKEKEKENGTFYPDSHLWEFLSENPSALKLIRANLDKVWWTGLCKNPHPDAFPLILEHAAINRDKCADMLHWLCQNPNPNVMFLLEGHGLIRDETSYMVGTVMSANPNAIPWLRAHPARINRPMLCTNPNWGEAVELLIELFEHDEQSKFMHALTMVQKQEQEQDVNHDECDDCDVDQTPSMV